MRLSYTFKCCCHLLSGFLFASREQLANQNWVSRDSTNVWSTIKEQLQLFNTCQPRRSNFWNLGNKITGFASEVSEGGLCLCSHPWKNPPNIQLEVKPQLYWDKLRCLDFTLREQARSSNVILTLGKELKRNKSTSTIWYQLENSASAHIM